MNSWIIRRLLLVLYKWLKPKPSKQGTKVEIYHNAQEHISIIKIETR